MLKLILQLMESIKGTIRSRELDLTRNWQDYDMEFVVFPSDK